MPRTHTPAFIRAALLGAALVIASACVSVTPPTPTPTSGTTQPPSTTVPATASPSATAPPVESPASTPSPGESPTGTDAPATPGATVDPQLAGQIDAVTVQIPPIRQLEPTRDTPYEFISRDQFRDELLEVAFEDVPEEWRLAEERLLKRLGLLPADADLTQLIIDLYGASVAAYYRPETGRFYIIERDEPFGPTDKLTVAHEFAHALQDQHFDLEGTRIKDLTEGDATLAQLAAIEGDAVLVSQEWLTDHLSDAEKAQLLMEAIEDFDNDLLEGMPLILRRQLEFPYGEGFLFARDLFTAGGFEAINGAIQNPPASTEQILHPEKYFEQEAPVDVTLDDESGALGAGWSLVYEQTVGELGIQVLATGGERPPFNIPGLPVEWPHQEAAAGWGGDRLNMYENGDQWAIVWETAWDTEADADEFENRVTELLSTFDGSAQFTGGPSGGLARRLVIASDAALLGPLLRPV
jgi:hypothetical protein